MQSGRKILELHKGPRDMAKIESLQPQVKINRLLQRQQRVIHQENLAILDRLQRCESHYNVSKLTGSTTTLQ